MLVEEDKAERLRCERSVGALAELAQTLLPYRPKGIVLEATGGFGRSRHRGTRRCRASGDAHDPKRVRDFEGAHGLLAKADALDAYALPLFGTRMRPPLRA